MQSLVNYWNLLSTIIEKGKNIDVGALDYSKHPELKEKATANARFQGLLQEFFHQGGRRRIESLNLSGLAVSGGALFGPDCGRLSRNLKVLNLSATQSSSTFFKMLASFPKLERLFCERCPNMNIGEIVPHQNIKFISIRQTNVLPSCIRTILKAFPKLERLDCTINLNDQVPLGLRHRHGLKRAVISLDTDMVSSGDANVKKRIALFTLDVTLRKTGETWNAFLLDAKQNPITDELVYFHESCRQFFTATNCGSCNAKDVKSDFHQIHLQLDSSVDFERDFELLPPNCPYDLVRRSAFYQ